MNPRSWRDDRKVRSGPIRLSGLRGPAFLDAYQSLDLATTFDETERKAHHVATAAGLTVYTALPTLRCVLVNERLSGDDQRRACADLLAQILRIPQITADAHLHELLKLIHDKLLKMRRGGCAPNADLHKAPERGPTRSDLARNFELPNGRM